MKLLFWLLIILSLPVSLFVSVVCYFAHGLDLAGTGFGVVVCLAGILSLVVTILCAVLGIFKLRKGNAKKAVLFAVMGVLYSVLILAGFLVDEMITGIRLEKSIAANNDQRFGEGWNSSPTMEGISKHYLEILNMFDVAVEKSWPASELMDLGAVSMPDHYGSASADNIGFTFMDLNGDAIDELIIGTTAPVQEGGTAIFCIYSDPENPHYSICSVEGETYYLYPGETDGAYLMERADLDLFFALAPAEGESLLQVADYTGGPLEPAGRLVLELTPFSQYK